MKTVAATALLVAISSAAYGGQGHVHAHGQGNLTMVQDGKLLQAEVSLPGMDAVGFEHAPRTDAHHAAITSAVDTLSDATRILRPADAAQCRLIEQTVGNGFEGLTSAQDHADADHHDHHDHHDHDHKHDHHAHPDMTAAYLWECERPQRLNVVEVPLTGWREGVVWRVEWVTEQGTGTARLTDADQRLSLSR